MMKKQRSSPRLVPIESLGVVTIARGDIRIERLETRLAPRVPFPHRHEFFHIVYIHKGHGWHEIDFHRYPLRSRQIFVMKPGQVHSWRIKEAKGFVLEFTSESLNFIAPLNSTAGAIHSYPDAVSSMAAAAAKEFEELFLLMLGEFDARRPQFEKCLIHYLGLFFIHLERTLSRENLKVASSEPDFASKFRVVLEEQFRENHGVEYYAKRLGVTPKALTMRITRATGISVRAVILERCLLEAKRMLAYSDRNVTEIAYSLGFDDPNYFTRFFKKSAGVNPSDFRQAAKKLGQTHAP